MGNTLHLYIDEAKRTLPGGGEVFIACGLSTERPVAWTKHAWYQEILKHPHAAEGRRNRKSRGDLIGMKAWNALDSAALPGAHLTLVGFRTDGGTTGLRQSWDIGMVGLFARVAIRAGLTSHDTLQVYSDRADSSSGRLQARLLALGASLRWLLPDGQVPRLEAEVWAKDPNHLVGVGLVDLFLYNVGRRVHSGTGHWADVARQACADMGISDRAEVVEVPPVDDPVGLQAILSLQSGELHRVDWPRLLRAPVANLCALIQEGLDGVSHKLRVRGIRASLAAVAPYAEDARVAERGGVGVDTVLEVLRALAGAASALGPPSDHQDLLRQHQYLAARAWSHAGRPERALEFWSRWDALISGEPLHPALLDEVLRGMNARAVYLTDLEQWEEAERAVADELALIDAHLGAFDRIPARGRALGALYQCRVLARSRLDTVFELIEASTRDSLRVADRSYGLTWQLVALGRGAPCPEPDARFVRVLHAAEACGWGTLGLENPYVLWGALEAATVESIARECPREVATVTHAGAQLLSRVADEPSPVQVLSLRSLGVLTRDDRAFRWSGRGAVVSMKTLRRGALRPRMQLRTLVSWCAATGSKAAVDATRGTQDALGSELHRLSEADALSGVRAAVESFLEVDPSDPDAGARWLARGGY